MKLIPIPSAIEPSYPTYRSASPVWRKLAAAIAASAALWLPACGEDTTRLSGEPPMPDVTQYSGIEGVVEPLKPEAKPPEVQNPEWPEPQVRLSGDVAPVNPPPEVRLAGRPRSPDLPKSMGY